MNFTTDQLVDSFTKRYLEDVSNKATDELFAIFEIIETEYRETNECPVCKRDGEYSYTYTQVYCNNGIFAVINNPFAFRMLANYCPICGKNIKS